MSNLGNYNKTSVWGNKPNMNQPSTLPPQLGALSNLNPSGIVPFQQQHQQVFQNMGLNQNIGLGLQQMANNQLNATLASNSIFQQQLNAVTYPNPRGLNPTAFQTASVNTNFQNNANQGVKQRVFTGCVTQVHDSFGFIDEEVFFQRNVCVKGSNPKAGDRVLVEASFNSTMPFKWNATRVQVLQGNHQSRDSRGGSGGGGVSSGSNSKSYGSNSSGYNAVPPPLDNGNGFGRRGDNRDFGRDRPKVVLGDRRNRSRDRDDEEVERKRRREDRIKEREKEEKDRKSPARRRSRSPKVRRRARIVPRYMVQIPKIALDLARADVLEIKRRYNNLYIPSDFFNTHIRWLDAFPADKPYALNKPCLFHIMNKESEMIDENDAVLEPADADYRYSAKVMLMSIPGIEDIYQKCCEMAEDKDRRDRDSEEKDFVHPTRLINFLVGLRGKNETMAIGGPWSPSLDGEDPENDPSVLIKTAIRSCKALTGIDLSNCTQWYRFVELYYRRSESTHKGKPVPARVESVVIFLPDVWSCLPTRLEWEGLQQIYRRHLEKVLKAGDAEENDDTAAPSANDEKDENVGSDKVEPTHYSQLDPKLMAVADLRNELRARNVSVKGLKSQLIARLAKVLKAEALKNGEEGGDKEQSEAEMEVVQDEKDRKSEPEEKKLDEQQKRLLEKRYALPEQPHLVVHPSKTAKSGKFDCTTMSLSLLLDYRPEDTKEHSFEVSLFAELFNEMLMRDFGFNIYKALYQLPQKPKEKDEDKKKKDDKKRDKDEDKTKKDDDKDKKSSDRDDEDKRRDKKDERKSDDSDDDEDEMDDRKDKKDRDKKKKDRVKLYTKDKHLLLSFVYFDQSHCGYIFDKDVEELIYTLGLHLSRSQVKKLVSKVITRDSLHYRKLTDKPKDEEKEEDNEEKSDASNIDWREIAKGNKKLLPVFSSADIPRPQTKTSDLEKSDNGLAVYRGAVVDIGKLLSQLERSEKARIETEQHMVELKTENNKLSEKYTKSNSTIKHLTAEVKDYKEKLRNTEDSLGRLNAHAKLFQTTLIDVRDKIEPVLKLALHKEKEERKEREREDKKKQDDSKSRWERDRESTKKEDIKKEHEIKKEAKDRDVKEEKKEIDDKKVEIEEKNDDGDTVKKENSELEEES